MRSHKCILALFIASSYAIVAQEANPPNEPPNTGWRKLGEPTPTEGAPAPASSFTLPAGSWITVRVDEPLSSDRNQVGDAFTATLAQPLVANGRVIARRGQTVAGAVVQAQKAGNVRGTSRLALELTELGLVDGRQIQIHTRMTDRRGDTSVGRDVGAVGTATAAGAAIGAAADGGFGAGMGGIAGAGAAAIGVLVTRGRATEIYPETAVTFRLESPITVETEASPEAFQAVSQQDYEQRAATRRGQPPQRPAYYGYPPYGYPPYFYGPRFFFYSGPRFYSRRGYYRRW